jgi:hypothetical protein
MGGFEALAIRDAPEGAVLPVKVVPNASRDRIAGVLGDTLKVQTAAAPEKGKANKAVTRILAKKLGVDRRAVALVSGSTSIRKEFRIAGLTAKQLRERLSVHGQ